MNRKRYKIKRSRRENQDNIRKKIKRGFLNNALIPKINMIIKKQGGHIEQLHIIFSGHITHKMLFEYFKKEFTSMIFNNHINLRNQGII